MGIKPLAKPLSPVILACVSLGLLIFWRILGQVLFPFNFNQLVQVHCGLVIFYQGMSTISNLDVPTQQLLGEMFQ